MLRMLALLGVSAVLYTYQLDRVPAFLTLDEAHFSVHGHAIATTGRNLNGDVLPALISLEDPEGEPYQLPWGHTYYLPFGIYLIAAALQVLPLDEATVRLPSALLGGVVNVALIAGAALALFRDRRAAWLSAAVLAFTPANVIVSRQAIDSVCQLPFTLGFLWCLGAYLHSPRPRYAFAAGAILGAGTYAYVTSVAFMPFFLVLFWIAAWRAGTLERRAWVLSLAGFAVAVLPMTLWLLAHPDVFASIRLQYNHADPGSISVMDAIASGGMGAAAREFARIYWSYFDPSFLFVQGGNARTNSTGEVGVFLMPIALAAGYGLMQLRAHRLVFWPLNACLLAAPIPAAIKGTPYQIQRASGLLIVISLCAGYGLASLWAGGAAEGAQGTERRSRRLGMRAVAFVFAIAMLWQFADFYRDYLGNYRIRSGHAFDPTAFRDAAELIIEDDAAGNVARVFLPTSFYDVSAKWRFYTAKHDRPDLWRRTTYYSGAAADLPPAPPGAVAVVPLADDGTAAVEGWATVRVVRNLMGAPTLKVVRREPAAP